MTCPLFGAEPLSEPTTAYSLFVPVEQTSRKYNENTMIFIQEDEFEMSLNSGWLCVGHFVIALSLVDSLSLLLSPLYRHEDFYFCQKYHLKDTYKIFKKFMLVEWCLQHKYWLSCECLPFEAFFSYLCEGLLGITYANMPVTTQWPLKRAAHLPSLVWVCVVWRPESLMELSVLCVRNI